MKKCILKKCSGFKQWLIAVKNLESFQQLKKENRKEIINLVKFQFEVIVVIVVIFGLFKDFFPPNLTDLQRINWTNIGFYAYFIQISISILYIFLSVLFATYMDKKELHEATLNVSIFVIFFEIISSLILGFLIFLSQYKGEYKVLEISVSLVLILFCVFVIINMILERIFDKEKTMKEQQNEKSTM